MHHRKRKVVAHNRVVGQGGQGGCFGVGLGKIPECGTGLRDISIRAKLQLRSNIASIAVLSQEEVFVGMRKRSKSGTGESLAPSNSAMHHCCDYGPRRASLLLW